MTMRAPPAPPQCSASTGVNTCVLVVAELAVVQPKLAVIASAAGMEGAVLCQHDRSAEPKRR